MKTAKTPGLYNDSAGLHLKSDEGGSKSWIFRYQRNGKPAMGSDR